LVGKLTACVSFLSHSSFVTIRIGLEETLRFNELVRLLEQNGFRLIREKGSVRYYAKAGVDRLIRVDYLGAKEIPTGTCNAILKLPV
jgi:predicted RNA binding protein YcfA (HicA-like mRNA interferase family)